MSNDEIRAWAAKWLADGFVVLDTETTGLRPADELVEISIITHTGDVVLDTLVRTAKRTAWPEAQRVHGISPAMVATAPPLRDVQQAIFDALNGRDVMTYNAHYDFRIVQQSYFAHSLPLPQLGRWHDVMAPYAEYHGEWNAYYGNFRWQKLTDACRQMAVPDSAVTAPAHRALGDCQRTLALMKALAK